MLIISMGANTTTSTTTEKVATITIYSIKSNMNWDFLRSFQSNVYELISMHCICRRNGGCQRKTPMQHIAHCTFERQQQQT